MSKRLEQLFSMLKTDPDEPFLLFAIAKEYEKNDNKPLALQYYLQLTTDNPDYVGTYYHLGKLYEKMEAPDLALEIYDKGMEIAQKVGDKHAYSELSTARWELE